MTKKINEEFAEAVGIFLGDGSLYVREYKDSYEFKIVGNNKKEREYYEHVSRLFSEIIGREITPREWDCGRSYGIRFCSKTLAEQLFQMGIPKKRKTYRAFIPNEIMSNEKLSAACLTGLFDTDGCLTIKKRYRARPYYPVICFTLACAVL